MGLIRNQLIRMIKDKANTCEDIEAFVRRSRRDRGHCRDLHRRHFWTGRTPLIEAVLAARMRVVAVLLDSRVDVDAQDYQGNSALHYAVMAKRLDLVQLLCRQLLDLELINHDRLTPLQIAVEHSDIPVAQYLIEHEANLDVAYVDTYQTVLMKAIMNQCHELVRYCVAHGAELDFCDRVAGRTALMHAVCLGDHVSVDCLLDAGVNVLIRDFQGQTVWDEALLAQDAMMIQKLLRHGAALGRQLSSGAFDLKKHDLTGVLLIDAQYDDVPVLDCLDRHGQSRFCTAICSVKSFVEAVQSGRPFNLSQELSLCHYLFDLPELKCFDRHTILDRQAMISFVLNVNEKSVPFLKGLGCDVTRVKIDYLTRIGDMLTPLERIAGFVNQMDARSQEVFGHLCLDFADSSSQAGSLRARKYVYDLVPRQCQSRLPAVESMLDQWYEESFQRTLSPLVALREVEPLYHELGFDFNLDDEISEHQDFNTVHVASEHAAHLQLRLFMRLLAARQELETKQRNRAYFKRA